jgi:hypothetical protein
MSVIGPSSLRGSKATQSRTKQENLLKVSEHLVIHPSAFSSPTEELSAN